MTASWERCPVQNPPEKLDAFGHMTWTVDTVPDEETGETGFGYCFDAVPGEEPGSVCFEVVSYSDNHVELVSTGTVDVNDLSDLEALRTLPTFYYALGLSMGEVMDPEQHERTNTAWQNHVRTLI